MSRLFLIVLLSGFVLACERTSPTAEREAAGAAPAAGPVLTRSTWLPLGDQGPPPAVRDVARHDPAISPDAWSVDAPWFRFQAPEWLPDDTRDMAIVGAARREQSVSLSLAAPLDRTAFQRVLVVGSVDSLGGVFLTAQLRRDGKLVATSTPARVTRYHSLEVFTLDLPRDGGDEPDVDELVIVVAGGHRRLAVAEIVLQAVPPGHGLARAGDTPRLVRALGEARPAVALLPGQALRAEVDVPAGGRLTYSWCQPARGSADAMGSSVILTLDDGEQVQRLASSASPRPRDGVIGWTDVDLDLSSHAGGAVTLQLAQDPDGAATPLAVTGPVLRVPSADPPTVLLITSDTHRADHLGAHPAAVELVTPVLDALAARGVQFTDCYAPVNNTNPSHAALMTGTHPRDTGVLDNYHPLSDDPTTLAEAFAAAGWTTWASVSARHLGPEGSGLGQGFDRVAWPEQTGHHPGPVSIDTLLDWLPDAEGRPLFVWLHLFDVHRPYDSSTEAAARHWDPTQDPFDPGWDTHLPDGPLDGELVGLRDVDWGHAMYRAEVETLDESLRRVLEHPRLGAGVVAFLSDHGESLGEHGLWFEHRGAYPSTLHIPLVLAGPGVPEGRSVARPVSHLPVAATLLRLAGLDDPRLGDGDLLAELDASGPSAPRFAIEARIRSATVNHNGMHLVLHLADAGEEGDTHVRRRHQVELYDLATDPTAEHDLVAERHGVAAALRKRLIAWLAEAPDHTWTADSIEDPTMTAALAELGYAGGSAPTGGALFEPDGCEACALFDD